MFKLGEQARYGGILAAILLLAAAGGCNQGGAEANTVVTPNEAPGPAIVDDAATTGTGMSALEKTAGAGKYLFALFWKEDDDQTRAMKAVFEPAVGKVRDRADAVIIRVSDPAERPIVKKFELDRAPMPLVLVLAPNGAITGGFPEKCDEEALLNAFATPCTERCMKALQDGKLVFVCAQNGGTKANEAALRGVRDFQADARYGEVTEVLLLDPADGKETSFLGDLQIQPATPDAVTVLLAPPGAVVAEFTGATTKEELVAALEKASSGCCPGGACGPGGCAPPAQP